MFSGEDPDSIETGLFQSSHKLCLDAEEKKAVDSTHSIDIKLMLPRSVCFAKNRLSSQTACRERERERDLIVLFSLDSHEFD